MSFIELLFSNLQSSFEMLVILFETLVKTFLTKKISRDGKYCIYVVAGWLICQKPLSLPFAFILNQLLCWLTYLFPLGVFVARCFARRIVAQITATWLFSDVSSFVYSQIESTSA